MSDHERTGGPAYPTLTYEYDGAQNVLQYDQDGMTVWDHFMGQALASWSGDRQVHCDVIARWAANIADASVAERRSRMDVTMLEFYKRLTDDVSDIVPGDQRFELPKETAELLKTICDHVDYERTRDLFRAIVTARVLGGEVEAVGPSDVVEFLMQASEGRK